MLPNDGAVYLCERSLCCAYRSVTSFTLSSICQIHELWHSSLRNVLALRLNACSEGICHTLVIMNGWDLM